jgi:alkylation response protein AidB-like acyl-CoA dehydrogenase
MFDLQFNPAQERLRGELKKLAVQLRQYARQAEDTGTVPEPVRHALADFGLPGHDGFASGASDPVSFCLAAESLAWADAGIAYAWLASRQVAWVIAACGTEEQKSTWLPRFARDPFLPASLYLYEGRGASPSETQTQIRRGGLTLTVNGYKSPVMYPHTAEVAVIVGQDERGALTAVVTNQQGSSVRTRTEQGGRRLAMTACPSAIEAFIRDLSVPKEAELRPDGLLQALTICRMAHASVCLGTAASAIRYAGDYAQQRVAFGKPIVGFQGISFMLTDLLIDAEALRLSLLDVVTADLPPLEREHRADAVIAAANQLLADSGREGVQIMGVAGVLTQHPQERVYRNAAVLASIDFDPLHADLAVR